jgi:hypothetical protein
LSGDRTVPDFEKTSNPSGEIIPAQIVIGVSGHRKLRNERALAKQVQKIVIKIKETIPELKNIPVEFRILSPLAEGADRLVTRELLKVTGSQLQVVLPLDKDEYLKDFAHGESREEFNILLESATSVIQPVSNPKRPKAYMAVGRYIVDHCDVLIAIWDGNTANGKGGTADVVDYAREKKCPVFWIHSNDPKRTTYEEGRGFSPEIS